MTPSISPCTSTIELNGFATVCEVVAKCLEVDRDQLMPETLLREELGLDSIDLLALVVGLEENLDIAISDQTLSRIRTIGDLVPSVAIALELRCTIVK